MKKIMFLFFVVMMSGCSYGDKDIQDFVDDPGMLLQDPHYAQHQKQLDSLEHSYLKKEITYAKYLEEKKRLEDQYDGEVQHRQAVIENR